MTKYLNFTQYINIFLFSIVLIVVIRNFIIKHKIVCVLFDNYYYTCFLFIFIADIITLFSLLGSIKVVATTEAD